MKLDMRNTLLVITAVLLFFAVYFTTQEYLLEHQEVDGFKLNPSRNFTPQLKEIFNRSQYLVLKQELYDQNDSRNTAIAAASAELVYAAFNLNKQIYNYGVIDNKPLNQSDCTFDNRFCGQPDIIMKIDDKCNCFAIQNGVLIISGDSKFLFEHAVSMRKLANAALSKIQ